uniref:Putative RNA-dependent RNA polymerase n=1 Tax=Nora virus TaxID=3071212 RepID=A0A2S0S4N9_NORAV|nr:putative RNA-dependent RNA polymerase [Drosophila melanogaster Nora virus]
MVQNLAETTMLIEAFINSLLQNLGIMMSFRDLVASPWILLVIAIPLCAFASSASMVREMLFRHKITENILKGTGVEELFNPFGIIIKYFLYFAILYAFIKYIRNNINIITEKVNFIRRIVSNPTGTTGRRGVLGRCVEQIIEYPTFFITMVYELQQIKNKKDLISKITMISSILKLPLGIWESTVGRMLDRPAIEGTEEMLEDVLPMVAMGLTITKTQIGDVPVENFLVNLDRNQKACENIIKRMQPILVKLGIVKDSSYDTILEIAEQVNKLSDDEVWMKTVLKTNPNEFLRTEGSVRVAEIRSKVAILRNKLNTLQSKELRSDKVVTECQKHIASLEILLIEAKVLESANQTRVKPVGVAIQGEKQIGKTNLVQILSRKVCEYVQERDEVAFRDADKWTTWSRQCRDEFDTGYTGQEITYVDDAFQQKDNKDHLMWFTFISNTAVGTNQADLKQKGLPYRSKLVFTTCNKLPDKSVTIEDIEALHARFPHTIKMVRNQHRMPSRGAIDESYSWVDFYYGPMSRAVAATGSNTTSTLKKKTLEEIVELIGNDLIVQNKFYNSIIATSGVHGQEESLEACYIACDPLEEYEPQTDPLLHKFQGVIDNTITSDFQNENGVATEEVVSFIRSNLLSFRAWNLINSMRKNHLRTYGDWLEQHLKKCIDGALKENSLLTEGKIKLTELKGLQLASARSLLAENKLIELEEVPIASAREYNTVFEQLRDFIEYELDILDSDIVDVALTKMLLAQIAPYVVTQKLSKWTDVGDWIFALKNKVTGKMFLEHVDQYPLTIGQFLSDLSQWSVEAPELFAQVYKQKVLFFETNSVHYFWSPLLKRGTRIVKCDAKLDELVRKITNQVSWCTYGRRLILLGDEHRPQYARIQIELGREEKMLQNGFPILQETHSCLIRLVEDSTYRENTLFGLTKSEMLWNAIRIKPRPEDLQYKTIRKTLSTVKPQRNLISSEVREKILQDVNQRYSVFRNYYTNLTRNSMHQVISLLSKIGVPVNTYWSVMLMDNAPVITTGTVGIVISLLIAVITKSLQYAIAGEEQSKGEKRAKQKKLATTKIQRLRAHPGREEAEGDMLGSELKMNPELNTDMMIEMCDFIETNTNVGVVGVNFMQDPKMKLAKYAAFEETYDFTFESPQEPEWKRVTTYREGNHRIIEFNVRGTGTMDIVIDEIEHISKVAKYYPYGEWNFEIWLKRSDDTIQYQMVLCLLNAQTQAGLVQFNRADTKNIKDVEIQLNRGTPCDLKAVVLGQVEASTQAHDTMDAVINKNFVKVNCVAMEEVNELTSKGTQVYAIASEKVLILPAHAVRQNKWIRFSRPNANHHYGIAKVNERKVFFERDIAVANILTRAEAEQIMSEVLGRVELTTISRENFVFPSISKYLMTAEQSEVEWLDCVTLHYFAKNRTMALGRTKSFEVNNFECGNEYRSKKLVACAQGLQSQVDLSQRGDCGSPIILSTGKRVGKLLGFHSYYSKQQQTWFGSVLMLDDLGVINGQEEHFKDPWEALITKGVPTDLPNGPEVEYVGNFVRPSLPVTSNSLAHWHKSPFAEQFEEQLAPGRLDPYDPYIEGDLPLNRAGRKSLILGPNSEMAKTLPELDQPLLDWCVQQMVEEQVAIFKNNELLEKVHDDVEEAIDYALNGNPDNDYVRGMEVNKAAGLPWSFTAPKKSDYIEVDELTGKRSFRKDENGQALKTRVIQKLQQAKLGNRILSFSSSKLKDQPIKIAQAKSGRTRVFHCIPVDLIIFTGALYGPYKEAFTKAGLKCYHAVGIDPKSVGWHELAAYMTKHPNYFDADYKNYDKYLHRQVFKAVRQIQRSVIQKVKPDKWDAARACEEFDAIDTYVVDFQTVYKTNRGNKSGSYTTTIDNCLANDLYGLYAWVKTTGLRSLWDYRQNVSSVAFGDDIIKSVSDAYKDKYNYITYRDVLNATGHIMTPGSKDGEEKPFTSFTNLQFLKRGFVSKDGMTLAPLLQRSIEGPFVWTDIREDQTTVWVNLIQEQMIEASLWGEEYYTELCNKLKCGTNRVLNEAVAVLLNTSWEVTFQKFCDRYYGLKGGNL